MEVMGFCLEGTQAARTLLLTTLRIMIRRITEAVTLAAHITADSTAAGMEAVLMVAEGIIDDVSKRRKRARRLGGRWQTFPPGGTSLAPPGGEEERGRRDLQGTRTCVRSWLSRSGG